MSNQHVNTPLINTPKNDYPLSNSTQAVPANYSQSNNSSQTPFINSSSENAAKITSYNIESINNNHEKKNLLNNDNNLDKELTLKSTNHETYPLGNECNVKINNIVALLDSGYKLNLKHIGLICQNTEYNPKRFNALTMRLKEPKIVALIFDSGKIIVTGATTEEDSRTAARKLIKILRNCGFKVGYKSFKITNIVSSCNVNFPIRLTQLNAHLCYKYNINNLKKGNKVYYEPEVFPGLIYRMEKPKLTLLIFEGGKINFVGAKKQEDIFEAYKKIYPIVVKYENKIINNDNKDENPNNFNHLNIFKNANTNFE